VAIVSIAVIGGSLAGCSRTGSLQSPAANSAAVDPAPTASPAAGSGSDTGDPSLSRIQADLNAADSSTANADGDVAAGDAAAATPDN